MVCVGGKVALFPVLTPDSRLGGARLNSKQYMNPIPDFTDGVLKPRQIVSLVQGQGASFEKARIVLQVYFFFTPSAFPIVVKLKHHQQSHYQSLDFIRNLL